MSKEKKALDVIMLFVVCVLLSCQKGNCCGCNRLRSCEKTQVLSGHSYAANRSTE